jgi:hypothetical protein
MHIIELDNVPRSQKIPHLSHLCYIRITVEPYMGVAAPPQCARCQQFFHVAANCERPLWLAPTVQRNNVSNQIRAQVRSVQKSEITARSTEVALFP